MFRDRVLLFFSILMLFFVFACQRPNKINSVKIDNNDLQNYCENKLTEIVVHNIFSPPVASRVYAYSNLAYYEALKFKSNKSVSLADSMKGFDKMPEPNKGKKYDFNLSAVQAFFIVAKQLTFSKDSLSKSQDEIITSFKESLEEEIFTNSLTFGDTIAATILKRSKQDNYKLTRGMAKYSVTNEVGIWQPTPPDYFDALEPNWTNIKPFLLDTAIQFAPPPPPRFSLDKNSQYYKELLFTYNEVKNITKQKDTIARYWDDNAFVTQHDGHLTYANKKTTPPGHWMGIISILSKQEKSSDIITAKAYALASCAMFDGFITCWTEKFKSKTIRPVTVIQEHLDGNWSPILQTPPFPEYISGHSVISSASAKVLEAIYGDSVSFTDTTELKYLGLKRKFKSLNDAAIEVGMSRIYGGIHYQSAIKEGRKQGLEIANYYLKKFNK